MPPTSAEQAKFAAVAQAAARHGQGIDPSLLATIAMHESGRTGPAHFGIKGGSDPAQATWEEVNGQRVNTTARFRSYPDADAAVQDFVDLVSTSPRYQKAWAVRGDPSAFVTELQKAGYATDSQWPDKIMGFERHLQSTGVAVDVPPTGAHTMAGNQPAATDPQHARNQAEADRTYQELQDLLTDEGKRQWWNAHKAERDAYELAHPDADPVSAGEALYEAEKKRREAAYNVANDNVKATKPKPTLADATGRQASGEATSDDLEVIYKNAQIAQQELSSKTAQLNAEVAGGRLDLEKANAIYDHLHNAAVDATNAYNSARSHADAMQTRADTQQQNRITNARALGTEAAKTYTEIRKPYVPLEAGQAMHEAINNYGKTFVPGYQATDFQPMGQTTDTELQQRARDMTMQNANAFMNFGQMSPDEITQQAVNDGIAEAEAARNSANSRLATFTAGASQ